MWVWDLVLWWYDVCNIVIMMVFCIKTKIHRCNDLFGYFQGS